MGNSKINCEVLKPIIDDILDSYINASTRYQFDSETQAKAIAVNRGLTTACEAVIRGSDNVDELALYTRVRLKSIQDSGIQEVVFK